MRKREYITVEEALKIFPLRIDWDIKKQIGEYTINIKKEDGGYWAVCEQLDGCVSQGDTLEELDGNMREAIELYLKDD